jgi:hypothetical protein
LELEQVEAIVQEIEEEKEREAERRRGIPSTSS